MKRYFRYIFFLIVLTIPIEGHAEGIVCSVLQDSEAYKENKSYKKLVDGKDGWVFRTQTDFREKFELNSAGMKRFSRIHQAFKDQNIDLVIALLPTRGMMHSEYVVSDMYDDRKAWNSYNKLTQQMRNIGISVATVSPNQSSKSFFYKLDHHWSPIGAQIMAQSVAEQVKQLSAYKGLNKNVFVTENTGQGVHQGTLAQFINKQCGVSFSGENVDLYKTAIEVSGEDELFGDTQPAEIVLIGTSNSTQSASKANFIGFLKEYIGVNVDNRAISGGGADMAFYQWLSSDDYKNNKPKIIVWEIPVYQDFDGESFFRQLIPSIYGGCTGKELFIDEFEVSKTVTLFDAVWGVDIEHKRLYAKLKFSDVKLNKLRAVTKYSNDKKDVQGLRRSKFYKTDGVFFYEFDNQREENEKIKEFSLTLPETLTGTVKAELCAYPSSE